MKTTGIAGALKILIRARQPVFIWGRPGPGKSAVVQGVGEALKILLRDVRALLLDPVDLRGLPFLGTDGRAKWARPDFLPQDGGILFLDRIERGASHGTGQVRSTGPGSQAWRIHVA